MDTLNANVTATVDRPEADRDDVLLAFARSLAAPAPEDEALDEEGRREAFLKLARAL